ncbi:MAG TPA: DUF5020 family protein [Saprospiraceae bacterium]|nr:DUF5020 family protein [Saprospiraceae bacterium]
MKNWFFGLHLLWATLAGAQNLQFHYDFRHSLDPNLNRRNFPSMSFEYFKDGDSTGLFLLKMQMDFNGEKSNVGQAFLQVSKNLRYWKPKVFLTLNYSGGLGITPPGFGYHISNSFGMGVAKTYSWKTNVLSLGFLYRYSAFQRASHDGQINLFFFRGMFNYRLQVAGSIVAWTQNRDLGIEYTKDLRGKKIIFFGDPQIWWKLRGNTSIGTRINLFYKVLTDENRVQVYPTLGMRCEL